LWVVVVTTWACGTGFADLVHVDARVLGADAVRRHVVEPPGEVEPHPVGQGAAMREVEAQNGVPRREQRGHDGRVGLRAGVGLDVRGLGAEQRLDPVDRQLLDDVDVLTPAVVALARVALGVLVREHGALRLHHRERREVLRGDHLERGLLTLQLLVERRGDLRVEDGERQVQHGRGGRGRHGCSCGSRGRAVAHTHGVAHSTTPER
jgi:hypothetical protein